METEIYSCPRCGSRAIYRYGRTRQGRQRYICLMCNRQFAPGKERHEVARRPACPLCGRMMNSYRRYEGFLRFRCSGYPLCRGYRKLDILSIFAEKVSVSP